jgi:tetratricopeptide (TPR) repeat protein
LLAATGRLLRALSQTGYLAIWQGAYQQSVALLEESMTLFKDLGDNAGVATSLSHLGKMAVHGGDHERAMVLCREAEALLPELVDRQAIGLLLILLGMAAQNEGDHDRGLPMLEESLALNRELGDMLGTAGASLASGSLRWSRMTPSGRRRSTKRTCTCCGN